MSWRKMKQLTVNDLLDQIETLDDRELNIPVVIVGERQKAVSAEIVFQACLDGDPKPVALLIQLIPC